jgi:quercetin dioxygenase-like cupin family protein
MPHDGEDVFTEYQDPVSKSTALLASAAFITACVGATPPATTAATPSASSGPAEDASPPMQVEQEPLHHVVLKNESVAVIHLTLPAGERTLYHTHTHDRVAVHLSKTSITQQKPNEAEGAASATSPGTFSVMTLEGPSYTHRVHNVGAEAFEVLDVELLQQPHTPSLAPAAAVAAENRSVRVYSWVLAPGATSTAHTHVRPFLLVAATGCFLTMTSPRGQSSVQEMKLGDFRWVDSKITHSLSNAGDSEAKILEIELK